MLGRDVQRHQDLIKNRLLRALPPSTMKRLRPALQWAPLAQGQPIDHVGGRIEHVFFVNGGFVSAVKTMRDGRAVEVSGIGIEGMTDPYSLFGIEAAMLESVVQVAGSAFRIQRALLQREMDSDPGLQQLIQNYARFAYGQLVQTAACNCLHTIEQRCCRWLLTAHDSALSDSFPLTHEFLAMMLGVQRSGVSIAAGVLKRAGMIDYGRGEVRVLDRRGLEEAACECYGSIRGELERLLSLSSRKGVAV
jgi:CRP-like cAMP-binding protein